MSSISKAAARRRSYTLAASLVLPVLVQDISATKAQQTPTEQLPPIEVSPPGDQNRTRTSHTTYEGSGARRTAPNISSTSTLKPSPESTEPASMTTIRQFNGIVGTSATVITADDIAHSP